MQFAQKQCAFFGRALTAQPHQYGDQNHGQYADQRDREPAGQGQGELVGIDNVADAVAISDRHFLGGTGELAQQQKQRNAGRAGRNASVISVQAHELQWPAAGRRKSMYQGMATFRPCAMVWVGS